MIMTGLCCIIRVFLRNSGMRKNAVHTQQHRENLMETAIFAYSQRGCGLAEKIRNGCFAQDNCRMYTIKRLCRPGFVSFEDRGDAVYHEEFSGSDILVFIGAAGIAVRKIAPYVKDKKTDPAVICIDERGTFVIPLMSGHIGGANEIAGKLASYIGAFAAITTATDVNGRFAVDEWAARRGFVISDMKMAKYISARILEQDIPIYSEFPVVTEYPPGTFRALMPGQADAADAGIYIGIRTVQPFRHTLRIIPPVLRLGIGCRKGTDARKIEAAVEKLLNDNSIDMAAVRGVYSIDLKADEAGLSEYCKAAGLKFTTYSSDELKKVPGSFSSSAFVESVTGVDNVCERAAAVKGRLIVRKTVFDGVTAALAAEELEIEF